MNVLAPLFTHAGFTATDVDRIVAPFTLKAYDKGDHFVRVGQVSKHLGFAESGVFQYYYPTDGEERTTYVTPERSFIACLGSFLKGIPSIENIRAITDARVWLIEKQDLKRLLDDVPAFKDYYIGLLEWQIGCIDTSRHDLLVLTAEQRYQKLVDNEPELLQRIPLQYLASILGVTPRHLSRIRKSIH
jgi:CRP-like cAMP-binding protein